MDRVILIKSYIIIYKYFKYFIKKNITFYQKAEREREDSNPWKKIWVPSLNA